MRFAQSNISLNDVIRRRGSRTFCQALWCGKVKIWCGALLRSGKERFRQIIIDRVIRRVDIDALDGSRLIEIDVLERPERLDLFVRGQLTSVPASMSADESVPLSFAAAQP